MIAVSDFHKAYGDVVAVNGLSFTVQPGEILGLIGPNGAGKTTTLRTLAGIIPPTEGVLQVAGHDVVTEPVAAKRVLAYVPDEPKLFDALTVWEHLIFMASAYNVPDFEPRGTELLDLFNLTPKRDTAAQELSRGMRQKIAICCAYLYGPKALMFDEPLTGLDPAGIRTIKEAITGAAADGAAVILSSHMLGLVDDLCTHLLILDQGVCRFVGSIAEARASFDPSGDASLEKVFFRATETEEMVVENGAPGV